MVGDPSGRSEERNLLDGVTLTNNVEAVAAQLRSFLRFDGDLGSWTTSRRCWSTTGSGPWGSVCWSSCARSAST